VKFYIEISDEAVERVRSIEGGIERARAETAVMAAIDREAYELHRRMREWALGNEKEAA